MAERVLRRYEDGILDVGNEPSCMVWRRGCVVWVRIDHRQCAHFRNVEAPRTLQGSLVVDPTGDTLTCLLESHLSCGAVSCAANVCRGTLNRRLQPFHYLHSCSGCFRLERLPGGACTHWKAPPFHGARRDCEFVFHPCKRSFAVAAHIGQGKHWSLHTQNQLDHVAWSLNTRRRKTLGWYTPAEVFSDHCFKHNIVVQPIVAHGLRCRRGIDASVIAAAAQPAPLT